MKIKILYTFFLLCVALTSRAQEILPIGDVDCGPGEFVTKYFQDYDKDGAGNAEIFIELCSDPGIGWVAFNDSDCDDNNPDVQGEKNWYFDKDNDGLGSTMNGPYIVACEEPFKNDSTKNYVTNNDDCNDNINAVRGKTAYYLDNDKDGQAAINASPRYECSNPSTTTTTYVTAENRTDCDDTNPNIQQRTWYKDIDGDGFGEPGNPIVRCQKPNGNYIDKNDDLCPGVYGDYDGCPAAGENTAELWNTVLVTTFDITRKEIGKSKSYFDELGKSIQSQAKDYKTGKIWANEIYYDSQGRPALQTLSAPTNEDIPSDFLFRQGLLKKSNGSPFTKADFENDPENPSLAGQQPNTVGWYYSTNNTTEPYQDVTQRPYSRTIYSELNPGSVLKTIGGNKIDGTWKNGYTFSMPAGQELSSPAAFGSNWNTNHKVIKTISRDVRGEENVLFTDTDGRTLATARSGGNALRDSDILINEQGYVDIHVPKGTTGVQLFGNSGIALDIYDLITEQKINTAAGSLSNGFYRITVRNVDTYTPGAIRIRCKENYYDYSLNYYDKAGRLLSSKQPLNHLESTFQYNSIGQLETTTSPDEGDASFKYRRDGQIRFSQNSKQKDPNEDGNISDAEFSYTNYDLRARPIESGVLENMNFLTADPDGDLPTGIKKEQHKTTYDALSTSDTNALPANYRNPSFLAGNVAKTENDHTTTYYSYDIYGRVQWIVQNITGLGIKTIDYEYNPVTSQVDRVVYQKGNPDQFIHRYTYDPIDYSLTKVETSTNGTQYTEHASYHYYETGALKRVDIAQGLQGTDYVYNLQGALKSINHPSLTSSNDPGGDANDLFGMIIDYHNHDYNRPLRNIKSADYGVNQYNGNIKGIRWNSEYNPIAGKEHAYSYQYNRNNWLQAATYGHFTGDYSSLPIITEGEEGTAAQDNITTTEVITGTKNYVANDYISLKPGFHAKAGSSVSAKISGMGPTHTVNAGALALNTNGDYKVDNLTYDANGNIQSLDRNKHTESGNNAMDKLSYVYKTDKPNQLLRVDDTVGDVAGAGDIGDQNGNNYEYNEIGQLIRNNEENISYLYNASGLVTEVQKSNTPLVKFFYNDKGHRVKKESYNPGNGNLVYTEHYVRDAAGTALAIYRNDQVVENTIYGASRLGVRKSDGSHLYQLTDHLGNVRAVVGKTASGQAMAMSSATDYYPFGMPMPGRNIVGDYRYAYQGQEKDPETGKEAFELRLWDGRIGRWLTTDPYRQFNSPYLGMSNNPINGIDPDGGFWQELGNWLGGKGWISNEGLDYLQTKGITNYDSHYSKNPLDPKGYHTIAYDNSDGELTFHNFKNVDDLGFEFLGDRYDYQFKISAGLQVKENFSDIFKLNVNLLSRTFAQWNSKDGFRGPDFYVKNLELKTGFGAAFYGINFDVSATGSEINDAGVTRRNGGLMKLKLDAHGGFTSLLQVGIDTDIYKKNSTNIYRQHGIGLSHGVGVVVDFSIATKQSIFKN
ncbi:RHS repeat domain-containing protein [Aquimarina celericrescens]|uniref:RHS repeat domain-containing protein n=1 Tax=Aquimarina celericrescens TaxID=1964542 RepID=A0ABW5ASI0_9FLAO|nr:hypothetical protein [Aquimarina celericrescens]